MQNASSYRTLMTRQLCAVVFVHNTRYDPKQQDELIKKKTYYFFTMHLTLISGTGVFIVVVFVIIMRIVRPADGRGERAATARLVFRTDQPKWREVRSD